jgi:hypothetical protein
METIYEKNNYNSRIASNTIYSLKTDPSPTKRQKIEIFISRYISIVNFGMLLFIFSMIWGIYGEFKQTIKMATQTMDLFHKLSPDIDKIMNLANSSFVKVDTIYDLALIEYNRSEIMYKIICNLDPMACPK